MGGKSSSEQKQAEAVPQLEKMRRASGREQCYRTKDEYYRCLEERDDCQALQEAFENTCPKSWQNYFHDGRKKELIIKSQISGS